MTPEALALFARTFVIGVAVAAPVGAMGVLCIQRTLARGWGAGISTGLGVATADAIYAGMAAFGMSAFATTVVAWQTPLRVVGGIVLVALGVRAAISAPPCEGVDRTSGGSSAVSMYGSSVALTLTNPMTIMAFGAVFAGAGLAMQPDPGFALLATAGVGLGSLAWWLSLVTGVSLARQRTSTRLLQGLNRVSGIVIAGFGVLALASVL